MPEPRGMAQNEEKMCGGIRQEIKMPLDGAGNPEAKKSEVSLTAPYFTWACFLAKLPFLVVRSRSYLLLVVWTDIIFFVFENCKFCKAMDCGA